ncbi:TrbI/VirB10 family protein, partial [Acidovorax sp.]|uniref:TrbI/VirB10 family protein n=1 Tax=Acidovorax sp. TaxID=1872122 RepID=UPI0025C22CCE
VNQAWLKEFGGLPADAALKPKLVKGSYVLSQGKVIPAILSRNINSDLPGEVTARVAVDVYDSFDGTHVLIPKGSELYGAYSSGVNVGQQRLMFAFRRVVLPNRVTFDLPAAKGMDLAGAAGVEGDVNNHFFKMFGTSMLFALLSYGAEKNEPAPSGLGSSGGARTAAGQALVDVSRTVLERNKTIPPTITVPAGTRINVQVASDMEFPSPYGAAAR